jgi:HK97 family phage major capsid protein
VVPTPAIPVNNFLVGAFDSAAQIFDRMDVEILLSSEHGSNFTNNEVTVRCEERLALAVKRPAALITGTLP